MENQGQNLDDLVAFVRQAMDESTGLVANRKYHLRTYKKCFVGRQLVDYIVREKNCNRVAAIQFGEFLAENGLIEHVAQDHPFLDDKLFYRFLLPEDAEWDSEMQKVVVQAVYKRMKQEVSVGTRQCKRNNTYKNCFVASEAIDWLIDNKRQVAREVKGRSKKDGTASPPRKLSRKKATEFGEFLRQKGYIRHVNTRNKKFEDGDLVLFRFVKNFEGEILLKKSKTLSALDLWEKQKNLYKLSWPEKAKDARCFFTESGWHVEAGCPHVTGNIYFDKHIERNVLYFAKELAIKAHRHYVVIEEGAPAGILSIETDGHRVADEEVPVDKFRAVLFTKEDNLRLLISLPVPDERKSLVASHSYSAITRQDSGSQLSRKRKGFSQALANSHKKLNGVQLKKVETDVMADCCGLTQDLIAYEQRLHNEGNRFKWGVLYCKPGQTAEDDLYSNDTGSEAFEEFLQFLGTKVELKTHTGYMGGLSRDTEGSHSIYTEFNQFQVMYHVAPYIPSKISDTQHIARKKHLGNDIVVIVFKEANDDTLFDPETLRSHFNRKGNTPTNNAACANHSHTTDVICVIKVDNENNYWVNIAFKPGVRPNKPFLPHPASFKADTHFREFLMTKLINAEIESLKSPEFLSAVRRTRGELLKEIIERHHK